MPFVGNIVPGSALGLDQKDKVTRRERAEAKKAADAAKGFARVLDEADLTAPRDVEPGDAVRSVKANEAEESHEDRTEHGYYNPVGGKRPRESDRGGNLDLKG